MDEVALYGYGNRTNVHHITEILDPKFKESCRLVTGRNILVNKRNKYNEVHKRIWCTYGSNRQLFPPLKILKNALDKEEDVAEG